jgi:predicted RNA-binding protein with RPS1 domain
MAAPLCDHNFVNNYPDEVQVFSKVYAQIVTTNNGKGKVKVTFTLEQATKAQRWSRGIAPLFL